MTRYIRPIGGGVSSISDAGLAALPTDAYVEVTEAEAQQISPALFGATDPQVAAVEMHGDGGPVPDIPSTGGVGQVDPRQLDIPVGGTGS